MIRSFIKKSEVYSIIVSILMIILSIFMISNPLKSVEGFIIFFGIILIINGVSSFIAYFTSDREDRLYSFGLIEGLVYVLAGVLILTNRLSLVGFLPMMLGAWIIANNLFKLQISINLSVIKGSGWIWFLIVAILMIIVGVLCITNPFDSSIAITTLVGIFLLISEIINLIESICILVRIK